MRIRAVAVRAAPETSYRRSNRPRIPASPKETQHQGAAACPSAGDLGYGFASTPSSHGWKARARGEVQTPGSWQRGWRMARAEGTEGSSSCDGDRFQYRRGQIDQPQLENVWIATLVAAWVCDQTLESRAVCRAVRDARAVHAVGGQTSPGATPP